nr:MAG TPA: hypothetical protein [Caudoviricetes sp.]
MVKEEQKDKIIEIVKKATEDNTYYPIDEEVGKVKQFLFVEDGSVDTDELGRQLGNNPEIAIVVYRQGSTPPQLVDVKE